MRRSWVAVVAAVAPVVLVWSLTSGATAATSPPASGGTLHVIATEPAFQGFDPQASYTAWPWEVLRCCLLRTLMAFPGLPDFPGTQPVPDLATGPPDVSSDGMTWTFHLRPGLHYAPPFQDVEITSGDFVRALLRAGNPSQVVQDVSNPGWVYLRLIDGFDAYSAGTGGSTISGVTTQDPHTITIREVRPDRTLADIFAMPFTAPIPPSPTDPSAPLGAATGHPWIDGTGYGPFQAATGPYMFEGAGDLDPSAPAPEQRPPSGMALRQDPKDNDFYSIPGTITLVRNPSWSAASDPVHLAYPDRIEIRMMPATDAYAAVAAGTTDTVMAEDPPPDVIRRYTSDPALQDRIVSQPRAATFFGTLNVAQPPFDDVHVRRALVALLDPRALARLFRLTGSPGTATSHLVPDPLDASHLASWYPADADHAGGRARDRARRDAQVPLRLCRPVHRSLVHGHGRDHAGRSGRRTGRRGRDVLPHGARRARDHPEVHPDAELPGARSVLRARASHRRLRARRLGRRLPGCRQHVRGVPVARRRREPVAARRDARPAPFVALRGPRRPRDRR